MKICNVDMRGRAQLRKLAKDLRCYYEFEEDDCGVITLTPMDNMDEVYEEDEY